MKFHHVGIACRDIDQEKALIKATHTVLQDSGNIFDKQQDAVVCLLKLKEGPNIELVSGNQVETLLKRGITYYHLCYEVDDLEESIKKMENSGGMVVSPPKPAILFNMKRVAFLYFPYGLIELLEKLG